jgi:hypothetical protein
MSSADTSRVDVALHVQVLPVCMQIHIGLASPADGQTMTSWRRYSTYRTTYPTSAGVGRQRSIAGRGRRPYLNSGAIDSHELGYTLSKSRVPRGIGSARAHNAQSCPSMFNDVSQRDCDPHRTCRVQRYSLRESSQSVGTLPKLLHRSWWCMYIGTHSARASISRVMSCRQVLVLIAIIPVGYQVR